MKFRWPHAWFGAWLVLLAPVPVVSEESTPSPRTDEVGLPLIQNFSPKDYVAGSQNWAIVQDSRGVLYVGNGHGVLVYDGVRFRLVRTTKQTIVRSLAIDKNDRVYVGAVGELGYLEADNIGDLRFVSMVDQLPPAQREFADVWRTFSTPHGVYFHTKGWLVRFGQEMEQVWQPGDSFHLALDVDGRIFIRERQRGLLELANNELNLVPDGEQFANERIYAMLPWSSEPGSVLIASRTRGLFVLDQDRIRPLPSTVEQQLIADQVYCGTMLPDGGFALGTINGGVYVFDSAGRFHRHYDRESGLSDSTIFALHQDGEGVLWLGLASGLARVVIDPSLHL